MGVEKITLILHNIEWANGIYSVRTELKMYKIIYTVARKKLRERERKFRESAACIRAIFPSLLKFLIANENAQYSASSAKSPQDIVHALLPRRCEWSGKRERGVNIAALVCIGRFCFRDAFEFFSIHFISVCVEFFSMTDFTFAANCFHFFFFQHGKRVNDFLLWFQRPLKEYDVIIVRRKKWRTNLHASVVFARSSKHHLIVDYPQEKQCNFVHFTLIVLGKLYTKRSQSNSNFLQCSGPRWKMLNSIEMNKKNFKCNHEFRNHHTQYGFWCISSMKEL